MSKKRSKATRKVFIETSVFIRFFTHDDAKKAVDCDRFFAKVEEGVIRPYVSSIVILEIIFVLTRLYKFPRIEVMNAIEKILQLRNVTLIEKTNTSFALMWWGHASKQYGDCLIASQIPIGVALATYDQDFRSFPNLMPMTPGEIM